MMLTYSYVVVCNEIAVYQVYTGISTIIMHGCTLLHTTKNHDQYVHVRMYTHTHSSVRRTHYSTTTYKARLPAHKPAAVNLVNGKARLPAAHKARLPAHKARQQYMYTS